MFFGRAGRAVRRCTRVSTSRGYAIQLHVERPVPGLTQSRRFPEKKAFQYNWYTRIITESAEAPVIILSRSGFTAERLKKLRLDMLLASEKVEPPVKDGDRLPPPTLTIINGGIFGAALRDQAGLDKNLLEKVVEGAGGEYAVLTLPALHPPYLAAVLRAVERSVPKRPEPTPAEKAAKEAAAKADPSTPGRRAKSVKMPPTPDMRVLGALIEGRVHMAQALPDISKLPTLQTLRAQIVGVLSAPSTQIAGVLSQASGGMLARTLEGFKKSLEDEQSPPSEP
ncbi:hypothetical protein CYLTODRAFT_387025 [Cylindrobasidium torrendii FP15055 ss-10]|uniref:50S ribosomal protein L10 n=1 Tax=Cylindrobasidium torrendii FP15055 ss-10 TaxID=1314674 RepID=A0A0D7BSL8_9AGAR|nr:hypothetical protein CYLTODRAFT_387025 [Cylindrobasidium torrendii FP15055 ss-10]